MAGAALKADADIRIRRFGVGEVEAVLHAENPHAPVRELRTMAQIISTVVEFVSDLPKADRTEIARGRGPFRAALQEAAQSVSRVHIDGNTEVERTRGSGLGKLLTIEDGRARLDEYATAVPMEDWAGPIAGAGEVERRLGIARTTLNTWVQQGAVVGLLRGQRKRAYPLEQFIDARPLEGVSDVLRLAPDPRSAWLWMRQPHGALDGRTPLALLCAGKRSSVLVVAQRDFDRESA